MDHPISIAIETSSRRGQVCLGAGGSVLESATFPADRRHAVVILARLDELVRRHRLVPGDVAELYVSMGPGGFTGLRVGVTVARTFAQVVRGVRCVAVPTIQAVAWNTADLTSPRLAVVMDAKEGSVYLGQFLRQDGKIVPHGPPRLIAADSFSTEAPGPITVIGEALWYCRLGGQGVTLGDETLWLPTAEGVWQVGRQMALTGAYTEWSRLLPLYLRRPEAVRLWEKNHPAE